MCSGKRGPQTDAGPHQPPPQFVPAAAQPPLQGRHAQTELVGHLLLALPVEVVQHQRLAVFVVEPEDRLAHLRDALILRRREHGGLGGDQRVDVRELEPLALEAARELAAHDGQQPGLGLALVRQRVVRLPGPQQRLLDHVLGEPAVPAQPPGEAQEVRAQALAEASETPTPVRFSVRAVHV